jgi:hypothetical protein
LSGTADKIIVRLKESFFLEAIFCFLVPQANSPSFQDPERVRERKEENKNESGIGKQQIT